MELPADIVLHRMEYDAGSAPRWKMMLSAAELERYAEFPSEKRRREFLLGRAALRTLVADHVEETPGDVSLRVAEDGAVELADYPHHVSLAHAGDRALAAMAPFRVGVDLEQIATYEPDVRRFALRSDEQKLIGSWTLERDAAFILVWTLKEAVLKARRTGLRTAPKKVHLDVDPNELRGSAQVEGETWQVAAERWDDFYGAVAWYEANR